MRFVTYFSANSCLPSRLRTAAPLFAALCSALKSSRCFWSAAASSCLALPDTHLPNAFLPFLFVPYFWSNACSPRLRSSRHCCAALPCADLRSLASSRDLRDTHLPNAFFLLWLVPYFCLNASRVAAVVPRSALH